MTPAVKYWVCKRGPPLAAEAMELLGGSGYVEESVMPRLYREMPLNSIWEGSGNVMCLDVLRAISTSSRQSRTLEIYFAEVEKAKGGDARLDAFIHRLKQQLATPDNKEHIARRITEALALAMQGALLVQHAAAAIADAFCASRLDRDWGGAFGTLGANARVDEIIARG
jgi:putative acyl-CoA dehydrogenase